MGQASRSSNAGGGEIWANALYYNFNGVTGWLGAVTGALSLINLVVHAFSLGIVPILFGLLATYRDIVHRVLLEFPFRFLDLFGLHFRLPPEAKDLVVLYVVFAMAYVRGRVALSNSTRAAGTRSGYKLSTRTRDFFLWPVWVTQLVQASCKVRQLNPLLIGFVVSAFGIGLGALIFFATNYGMQL